LWALLGKPSGGELSLKLTPRRHTRALSAVLKKIIDEQIAALTQAQIDAVRLALEAYVAQTFSKSIDDPEEWIRRASETLCTELSSHVVRPLIAQLDGPLKRSAYSVVDSLYSAETEMISAVASPVISPLEPTPSPRTCATTSSRSSSTTT
jgi:hypothetical protein